MYLPLSASTLCLNRMKVIWLDLLSHQNLLAGGRQVMLLAASINGNIAAAAMQALAAAAAGNTQAAADTVAKAQAQVGGNTQAVADALARAEMAAGRAPGSAAASALVQELLRQHLQVLLPKPEVENVRAKLHSPAYTAQYSNYYQLYRHQCHRLCLHRPVPKYLVVPVSVAKDLDDLWLKVKG